MLVVFQVVIVPQVILGMNVRTHFVMLLLVIMEVLVQLLEEQHSVLVLQGILELTVMTLVVMVSFVIMEDGVKSMLSVINQNVFVFQVSLVPTVIRSGHGTCSVVNGQAQCTCVGQWGGNSCSVSPCDAFDCQHGGTCEVSAQGIPSCNCAVGWTGPHCAQHGCDCFDCNGQH